MARLPCLWVLHAHTILCHRVLCLVKHLHNHTPLVLSPTHTHTHTHATQDRFLGCATISSHIYVWHKAGKVTGIRQTFHCGTPEYCAYIPITTTAIQQWVHSLETDLDTHINRRYPSLYMSCVALSQQIR